MSQTSSSLPEELARLERRLETLRSMQTRGRLTSAQYQEEIQKLTATDEQGRSWWLAGAAGAWHWWDGQTWVRGQPLGVTAHASKPSKAGKQQAQKSTRRIGLFAGVGCGAIVVAALTLVGVLVLAGYQEYRASPKIVEDIQFQAAAAAPLPLSGEQQRVRSGRGAPQAFMILFYDEELEDGSTGDVRLETWTYYTDGVEYTFINGDLVEEAPIEVEIGELAGIPYTPEQFQAYMDLEAVLASAGLDAFLVVPLEKELVEGGEVYYADRLGFGLKDGELRYVEALALEVED